MNNFVKIAPNVWAAKCEEEYNKGDIIILTTKYGKEVECEVYNLIEKKDDKFIYSIVRLDESYAQRKYKSYKQSAFLHEAKANGWTNKAMQHHDFLSLGEPIKIGHHSERRHRKILEENNERMRKAIQEEKIAEGKKAKAEYWEKKKEEINLSMPKSLELFKAKLEEATKHHQELKNDKSKRDFPGELAYAKNAVRDLEKKVALAEKLWA